MKSLILKHRFCDVAVPYKRLYGIEIFHIVCPIFHMII